MAETATAPSDAGATGIGSTVYGGQAVIEGVMMRSRDRAATAVRRADGSIVIDSAAVEPGRLAEAVRRIPVLRGTFALWDVFNLGARSLAFSARATLEDEQGQPGEPGDDGGAWIPLMMGFGLALGVVLFFLVPLGLTALTDRWIESDLLSNIVEGLIRVSVVVGYLAAISLLPDIYRTLQYHGAEHKTVNAVEAGLELIPSNVQRQSLLHPAAAPVFYFWWLLSR